MTLNKGTACRRGTAGPAQTGRSRSGWAASQGLAREPLPHVGCPETPPRAGPPVGTSPCRSFFRAARTKQTWARLAGFCARAANPAALRPLRCPARRGGSPLVPPRLPMPARLPAQPRAARGRTQHVKQRHRRRRKRQPAAVKPRSLPATPLEQVPLNGEGTREGNGPVAAWGRHSRRLRCRAACRHRLPPQRVWQGKVLAALPARSPGYGDPCVTTLRAQPWRLRPKHPAARRGKRRAGRDRAPSPAPRLALRTL